MPVDLLAVPSWTAFVAELTALVRSPSPPTCIYVQSLLSDLDLACSLVRAIFAQLDRGCLPRAVAVDLVEATSPRALFDRALDEFAGWTPRWNTVGVECWDGRTEGASAGSSSKRRKLYHSGDPDLPTLEWDLETPRSTKTRGFIGQRINDSIDAFFDGLRKVEDLGRRHGETSSSPRFLVLEHADRLRAWNDGHFLASVTRLRDLSSTTVHPVLVSHLPWSKLRPRQGSQDPVILTIPSLAIEDLKQILRSDAEGTFGVLHTGGRANFVDFLVSSFEGPASADVTDLRDLMTRLWPRWLGLASAHDHRAADTSKLVSRIRSYFDDAKEHYGEPSWYLPARTTGRRLDDVTTSHHFSPYAADKSSNAHPNLPRRSGRRLQNGVPTGDAAALPSSSVLLLLAGFVASYNPQRTDARLLGGQHDDSRRKAPQKRAPKPGQEVRRRDRQQLIGPKQFSLERLLAIYESISQGHGGLAEGGDLLQQVAALCRSQLLTRTSSLSGPSADKLDAIKLKCGITETAANALAKSHQFDLQGYLWEAD